MQPRRKRSDVTMKKQSGVTLVEVLVSMVIMALGLVSLAALQNYTLRYQLGSVHRAQLSGLLSDYAERVRSNLGQAPGEVANSPYLLALSWDQQAAAVTAPASTTCAGGNTCTPQALATADVAQWRDRVRRELPRGSVHVAGDAVRGLWVTFMWSDKEFVEDAGGDARMAPVCEELVDGAGLAAQSCCPEATDAPEGVRCARFSVVP